MVTVQWNLNEPMASYQEMFAVTRVLAVRPDS
jgi:hypothetical protein